MILVLSGEIEKAQMPVFTVTRIRDTARLMPSMFTLPGRLA
jgi:hypothetical protein